MKNMKKFPWICSFAAICVAVFMFVGVALAAEATPESAAKELTLDEAIKLALTNNPAGKIAVFDFEAAKGALTAARSARWPTISGSHTDSRSLSAPSVLVPNPVAVDRYSNSMKTY